MSLSELLPAVKALPRDEKVLLVHQLIDDLAREPSIPAGEYPVWSPYDSHDAATTLMEMLANDKEHAA
jgi:hypothetical protein